MPPDLDDPARSGPTRDCNNVCSYKVAVILMPKRRPGQQGRGRDLPALHDYFGQGITVLCPPPAQTNSSATERNWKSDFPQRLHKRPIGQDPRSVDLPICAAPHITLYSWPDQLSLDARPIASQVCLVTEVTLCFKRHRLVRAQPGAPPYFRHASEVALTYLVISHLNDVENPLFVREIPYRAHPACGSKNPSLRAR
jgi:hypothetical protein